MKNTNKIFGNITRNIGITALVAVIVFTMAIVGCDDGSDGGSDDGGDGFTLTDIPSEFNGKYILLEAETDGISNYAYIIGANSFNSQTEIMTLPRIANGRGSIPVWLVEDEVDDYDFGTKYSGSHTFDELIIAIFNTETISFDEDTWRNAIGERGFEKVRFSNGSAKRSWKAGSD